MLSPARRYNGQWYSRWLYIDVQLNVSSRRQSFDAAFEWWHGLELLMLVLETTVRLNSLCLTTETYFLWSDGF